MKRFAKWVLGPMVIAFALPLAIGAGPASAQAGGYGPAPTCAVVGGTFIVSPTTVTPGSTITASLTSIIPNDTFTVFIAPAIGTLTTNASGAGSGTFTIPSDTTPGSHTISVLNAAGKGCSVPITVVAVVPPSVPPTAPTSVPSAVLPVTGFDSTRLVAAGAAALGVGGLLILGARRRRRINRA